MFIFYIFLLHHYRLHITFAITREQYHNDIQQRGHKTSGKLQIFSITKKRQAKIFSHFTKDYL